MFIENIKVGWLLGRYSFRFVLTHKSLLLLPLLSTLSIITALALIYFVAGDVLNLLDGKDTHSTWVVILACVIAYFSCIFITIFFNVTLIAMVDDYFRKNTFSFAKGFGLAVYRIPGILSWTLITGSVGILIRMIAALEQKFDIPSIVSSLLEVGWAAATYFVVPIICFYDSASPSALYDESARLIRQTWGEGVIKIVGASLFTFVICIPLYIAFLVLVNTSSAYHIQLYTILGIAALLMMMFTATINGVLQTIFYNYADSQYIPPGFNSEFLTNAVIHKIEH